MGLDEVRVVVVELHDGYHARHGGNGVMTCWHVERRSVCIYSRLTSRSSSEVAAMIEGLLRHCTDAEIEVNYVDTDGTSAVGFAFTELLGFRLLPRLRNIGHPGPLGGATGPLPATPAHHRRTAPRIRSDRSLPR